MANRVPDGLLPGGCCLHRKTKTLVQVFFSVLVERYLREELFKSLPRKRTAFTG